MTNTEDIEIGEQLDLPALDFAGEDIMFLTEFNPNYDWYTSKEIFASEQNGELFNDTVYRRNLTVEEKLNVKIKQTNIADVSDVAQKALLAGDTNYDVVMPYISKAITIAQQGLLMNLYDVPYLSLEKSWWDQRANESLDIVGKLFFTTGDISILDNECTPVLFFNKGMLYENGLEDPYELVNSYQWTYDKLAEMTLDLTADVNGDGKLDNDDMWGFSCPTGAIRAMYFSSGERIAKKNSDGELEIVVGTERAANVVEKILTFTLDIRVLSTHTGKVNYAQVAPVFLDKRVAFVSFSLVDINGLRDAEFEFGILPYPIYEEAQGNYNQLISTAYVPSASVPYNCKNVELSGAVLEALAYYSVDTLTVAYYDNALKTRYIRDEESSDMLDIIFSSRVFDLGYIYNWGGLSTLIRSMFSQKSVNYASAIASVKDVAEAKMNETIEAFQEMK